MAETWTKTINDKALWYMFTLMKGGKFKMARKEGPMALAFWIQENIDAIRNVGVNVEELANVVDNSYAAERGYREHNIPEQQAIVDNPATAEADRERARRAIARYTRLADIQHNQWTEVSAFLRSQSIVLADAASENLPK